MRHHLVAYVLYRITNVYTGNNIPKFENSTDIVVVCNSIQDAVSYINSVESDACDHAEVARAQEDAEKGITFIQIALSNKTQSYQLHIYIYIYI